MNSLFGVELPIAVNFIVAFVVVLALIGVATWLVRRFGATRLDAASRSRQPRLAVVDSAAVDGRRKLVIIRRDNVEHLLMIGGPNDVVVESAIVRGGAPMTRDAPAVRGADNLPRAMPLPDANAWVAPPEPAPPPAPAVRVERERPRVVAEEPAQWPPIQSEPEVAAPPVRVARAVEPRPASAPAPARTADALAGLAAELAKPAPVSAPEPRAAPPARVAPTPVVDPAAAAAHAAADKNLADMAQRLEQALRQPAAPAPEARPPAPKPAEALHAEVRPAPRPAPSTAAPPTAPATAPKSPFEHLEQEMANLLGRPGKT